MPFGGGRGRGSSHGAAEAEATAAAAAEVLRLSCRRNPPPLACQGCEAFWTLNQVTADINKRNLTTEPPPQDLATLVEAKPSLFRQINLKTIGLRTFAHVNLRQKHMQYLLDLGKGFEAKMGPEINLFRILAVVFSHPHFC